MELRVLGCSGGIGADRRTTSLLIDNDILLDAGTGVGDLRLEEMHHLRHVLVTHSHLDHITGIPLLVDTLFDMLPEPLRIYSQQATIDTLKTHIFNWTIWPDFSELPNKINPVMEYVSRTPGEVIELGSRRAEPIAVEHIVPSVGYYVSNGEKALCFSGDTSSNDNLWDTLNRKDRLDFLIVECGFPEANRQLALLAKHYCPSLLAEDLLKLKHKPRIAITHLKPGAEHETMSELRQLLPSVDIFALKNGDTFQL